MRYPLEGMRVLDFSRVLAGPYATRMLSDLGADVLKVEPPDGDVTRHFGRKIGNQAGFYVQQNVGKRNVCVDLKADGARDLMVRLVQEADIVVENFRPGVMDKLGLGWDQLRAVKPELVMLSISGFGQSGPDVKRAAYAPIVHAETGLIDRQAQMNGHAPVDIGLSVADTFSSLHGLVGVLSAVLMARQSGEGQHVDISMVDVVHSVDDFAHYALDGYWPYDNRNHVWETPGGPQILISGDMKFIWHIFSTRDGLEDPTPVGSSLETKIQLRKEKVADYFLSFENFAALTSRLDDLNLAWGEVREFAGNSYDHPTVLDHECIIEIDDRHGGRRKTVQSPYRFSAARSGLSAGASAPRRGEHNREALVDWLGEGVDTEIPDLVSKGVLLAED